MKMSRKWLHEFVDLSLEEYDDHTFGEAMTVSGSKVEVTDDLSKTMHGVKEMTECRPSLRHSSTVTPISFSHSASVSL